MGPRRTTVDILGKVNRQGVCISDAKRPKTGGLIQRKPGRSQDLLSEA